MGEDNDSSEDDVDYDGCEGNLLSPRVNVDHEQQISQVIPMLL